MQYIAKSRASGVSNTMVLPVPFLGALAAFILQKRLNPLIALELGIGIAK